MPSLAPREVHIWCVRLEANASSVDDCVRMFSPDERDRLSRFRFDHLKTAFALSRGVLRALLGRYLGTAPEAVRFVYGRNGKPAVPACRLDFNLAHSGQLAVYAFTIGCELGVDVEQVHAIPDQEQIVRRFFSKEECDDWLELEDSERDDGFFNCWTRKEAYIKALGDGLSMPLDSFRVSLRPGEPALLIHAIGDPTAPEDWLLSSFVPAAGYVGALAIRDNGRIVRIMPALPAGGILQLPSGQ